MDAPNKGNSNYAYLKQLSTEKLESLLTLDPDNDALIDAVIEELLQRDDAHPTDVDQAWQEFQTYYNTPDATPIDDVEFSSELVPPPVPRAKSSRRPRRWRYAVGIAAALFLCFSVLPPAFGSPGLFQIVGHWNSEFLYLTPATPSETPSDVTHFLPDPDAEYETLDEALAAYDITEPVVPTIPDGFELTYLTVTPDDDDIISFSAFYSRDEDTITIVVFHHLTSFNPEDRLYQRDDASVDERVIADIPHYFFRNNDTWEVASWANGSLECNIQTTLSRDDLMTIVNSIYEE